MSKATEEEINDLNTFEEIELRAIVEKYKKIEGEWSLKDVEKFVQDISGTNYIREEVKLTDQVNQQAVKQMRDGTVVSGSLAEDIQKAANTIQPFIEAAKSEGEELMKWKRDKFDATFAKYIHRYFISQKSRGRVTLEESAFRDLHFMTNKYLELLGSVEFNSYMQTTLNKKLGLQHNPSFQSFLVDLMVNSVDFSSHGKTRSLPLEKFTFLLLQLDDPSFYLKFADVKKMYLRDLETHFTPNIAEALLEDSDFMLTYSFVSMAKNMNFFGQIDSYMKEFARIVLSIKHPGLAERLEGVLSKEIVIKNGGGSKDLAGPGREFAPHHNVLA